MKHERLFAIVNHLLAHGRTGAPELARLLEVSERTIYRDVDALSARGVPLTAFPGAGGGYEIAEGFRIDRSFLSGEELAGLTGVLRGFSEALKDARLARSLGKLAGLGSRGRPSAAPPGGEPAPPLRVTLTPWGGRSPDAALVELLRAAIAAHRVVRLSYRDAHGAASDREVEPFSAVLGGATWYLHAYCRLRGAFRMFRLSRVVAAEPLAEVFDPWRRAPVPDPFAAAGDEPVVDVVLAADPLRASGLAEAFGGEALTGAADGRVHVRFRSPEGDWLVRAVLGLGIGVEVVAPLALRAEVAAAALAVARANAPANLTGGVRDAVAPSAPESERKDTMPEMILATCGLDCAVCPAHIAFVKDDPELRRRTAEEWSKAFNVTVRPEDVFCSGCRAEVGPKISHCAVCEVRTCAIGRGLPTCAPCPDLDSCKVLAGYHAMMPGARERLLAARA